MATDTNPTPNPAIRRAARVLAPAALVLALGAGTAACGGDSNEDAANDAADELAEQLVEKGSGGDADVDIDSESGQVDIETEDGQMSYGDQTELPDDFPSDIPMPADYELTSATTSTSTGAQGWTITGRLTGADDSTFDDLVAEFTDAGWTKSSETTTESGGGTASTAMLSDDEWSVLLSTQVGVEDMDDSFTYIVTEASA